jgi:sulfate transport system substrate-binding protein
MNRISFRAALAATALAVAGVAAGCGSSDSGGAGKLSLVAYSTPKEAYGDLIPAFQKTSAGDGVSFSQSYGGSGDQERAVESGLPADIVALSLEPDINKLVKSGDVADGWNSDKFHGFVTDSVVVFAVRKGNPKHIRTWDDIVKPGVEVVTPNPFTSGGARWNIMAAYGAQLEQGKSKAQAVDYLKQLLKATVVQDKSARESLQTFAAGKGDVLLAYENEAIGAKDKDVDLEYVIPDQTILIENPIAVTTSSKNKAKAQAFIDWLHTPDAQAIFAKHGYRPVLPSVADDKKFPVPTGLFKIGKLGGWKAVNDEFFDPDKSVLADVERSLGVPTAK